MISEKDFVEKKENQYTLDDDDDVFLSKIFTNSGLRLLLSKNSYPK